MRLTRVITVFTTAVLILLPGSAFANSFTAAVPQPGAVLTISPNSISITTASPLSGQGSLIVVNDPNGLTVDDGSITINGNNAIVGMAELKKSGVYTVNYTLLSDTEDPLTGAYTFLFKAPASLGTPTPAPTTGGSYQGEKNLNDGSNTFIYVLLVLAGFVFIFLIWYAKITFGGTKKQKRK